MNICVQVPAEVKRESHISWSWIYGQFQMLGIKLPSSARAESALKHQTISLAPSPMAESLLLIIIKQSFIKTLLHTAFVYSCLLELTLVASLSF